MSLERNLRVKVQECEDLKEQLGAAEEANFLGDGMNGRSVTPRRSRHRTDNWAEHREENDPRDNFLLDFENACLVDFQQRNGCSYCPKGLRRHENAQRAEFMKGQVYPHHSDVDWEEYVVWVSHGGGDD